MFFFVGRLWENLALALAFGRHGWATHEVPRPKGKFRGSYIILRVAQPSHLFQAGGGLVQRHVADFAGLRPVKRSTTMEGVSRDGYQKANPAPGNAAFWANYYNLPTQKKAPAIPKTNLQIEEVSIRGLLLGRNRRHCEMIRTKLKPVPSISTELA